uniref:Aminotransferase n=1 Tax=Geoglobus ahangari TaxID=113653 RepID=A0A7C3YQN3_9EURY
MTKRVSEISTSLIRKMFEIAERAKKEGKDVISLSIGEPDFDTPLEIIEKAYRYMKAGYTHYTSNMGLEELREQIAERYGVESDEVMVTVGASEALLNASLAFIERGSTTLIQTPGFLSYFTYAKLCESKIYELKTYKTDFKITPEIIEDVPSDSSVVFLNYPNNPTGAVMNERELKKIYEIFSEKNVLVISDEVYDQIYYDVKPGSLAGEENAIVINGFSKTLAMTGWRIGFVIARKELLNEMLKIHQVNGVCAPAYAQKAIADILEEKKDKEIVKNMVSEFRKRRDFVYSRLRKHFEIVKPEGAFYMFPKAYNGFVEDILQQKGVALTPGEAFGSDARDYFRLSYATSMENLKKAVEKIEEFIENSGL